MLRIYPVCLEMVRDVRPYAERIGRFDRNLAIQLKKASSSVPLNVAEGSALRGGRRRNTYDIALGEAKETRTILETAEAAGYIRSVEPHVMARLRQIIGTLINVVR
jgi:four helix bundle protein